MEFLGRHHLPCKFLEKETVMENPSTFKIAEPCHENWNQMTPESQGRFCASCQRCVIDFSNKSTAEMKSIYDREGGDVCGRVKVSQLVNARPAVRSRFSLRGHGLKSLQLFALALMAAFTMLLHTPAKAQKDIVMGKIAYVPPANDRLEGKVTWDSGQPAVGVTVRLLRNGVEVATTLTNDHGRYIFADMRTGEFTVRADAGHGTDAAQIVEIKEHKSPNVNLVLADRTIMGGLRYEESKEMEPVEVTQPKELIQPLVFLDSLTPQIIEEIVPLHPEAEEKMAESSEPMTIGGFEVSVFPNPTRDHVTLRVTKAGTQELAATLVDLDGKVLRTLQINDATDQATKIDLSGLPSGIYILQLKAGEEHVTQRILKL
ncbi:MAG: hypothetical protein RLZZ519_590 [Bacteroidota bacterium]|jgi:hypothetical protein